VGHPHAVLRIFAANMRRHLCPAKAITSCLSRIRHRLFGIALRANGVFAKLPADAFKHIFHLPQGAAKSVLVNFDWAFGTGKGDISVNSHHATSAVFLA